MVMEDWNVFDCNHKNVGGLLLKAHDRIYRSDKNIWKKWILEPVSVDCGVLRVLFGSILLCSINQMVAAW